MGSKSNWLVIGIVAVAALLCLNLVLYFKSPDIPAGWAALLAAGVGFTAIAWQTHVGFKNLKLSQEHSAELERAARKEQAEISKREQAEARRADAKSLAAAIRGELVAAAAHVSNTAPTYRFMQIGYELMDKAGGTTADAAALKPFLPTIFPAYINRLGLLNASLVGDCAKIYARLQAPLGPFTQMHPNVLAKMFGALASAQDDLHKDIGHGGGETARVGI